MALFTPKRVMESPDYGYGVCLWQTPLGGYIMDSDQNYLCCFGRLNDPEIELKMIKAAKECGVEDGKPFWLPGFRKVSDSEWEDQMETLLEGGIPDPVDIYRQSQGG